MKETVYLSLGANIGNPLAQLLSAIKTLSLHPKITIKKISSFYKTAPIGPQQPDFFNLVLLLETSLSPQNLLSFTQTIENQHNRVRAQHWGPRTLDIDLLLYGQHTLTQDDLTLPHPRMFERGFVLIPLLEISPDLIHPNGEKIASFLPAIEPQRKGITFWQPPFKKILIASHNQGKIEEFRSLLSYLKVDIYSLKDINITTEVDETAPTFIENALLKARVLTKLTKLPTLADDSGLVVPILDGSPGIYSARFSPEGTDKSNNQALLKKLAPYASDKRQAYFKAVIALLNHEKDPTPIIAEGEVYGTILEAPQGEKGFGYDPLFYYPPLQKSFAQLSLFEKNQHSHRGKAISNLIYKLSQYE